MLVFSKVLIPVSLSSYVFGQVLSGHINLEQFLFFTPMTWSIFFITIIGESISLVVCHLCWRQPLYFQGMCRNCVKLEYLILQTDFYALLKLFFLVAWGTGI